MSVEMGKQSLEWLERAAADGSVHTVRVSWSDRFGTWRGKRLPVATFLANPGRRISFCDGMAVTDVNCDIYESTPFSNFETGYPDMYLEPRLDSLGPVGWLDGEAYVLGTLQTHGGEVLGVPARNVLPAVLARLAERGVELGARVTLGGRLMCGRGAPALLGPGGRARGEVGAGLLRTAAEGLLRSGVAVRSIDARPDGGFGLDLAVLDLEVAADQAMIAKAALKELSVGAGPTAVFMTMLPGFAAPALLDVELSVGGAAALDPARLAAALTTLRGLLQPSVTAFKAGPAQPSVTGSDDADRILVRGLGAAAEADPATALMAIAAAVGAALDPEVEIPVAPVGDLRAAADSLAASAWAAEWLGTDFVANAAPLMREEADLFAAAITDWELDRYWAIG
ncbi:MAG: hypothetical protein JST08_04075 [Actinobacteria bacterium]|nr:hypothetical protein [Actinomycetota bacterium]